MVEVYCSILRTLQFVANFFLSFYKAEGYHVLFYIQYNVRNICESTIVDCNTL